MKLIVISHPDNLMGEKETLYSLFDKGLERFHLRKPSWSREQIMNWLNRWPKDLRKQTIVHGHLDVCIKYGVVGVHHGSHSEYQELTTQEPLDQSKSFHSLQEIEDCQHSYNYGFLSPIFNSISKKGHNAAFEEDELMNITAGSNTPLYALGGVSHDKIAKAKELGFHGVAVLGAIWQNIRHQKILDEFEALKEACK